MNYFVLKENVSLWGSQPSILGTISITRQRFLFDSLASKHASTQIVFTTFMIYLDESIFYFLAGLENIVQCILSVKLSAPQIFLFDGHAIFV